MLLVKSCVEIVDNFYPPVCIIWKIAQVGLHKIGRKSWKNKGCE